MIIDSITIKVKRIIIISSSVQGKVPNQLHINSMDIERTRLLAHESIYWINMNAAIEDIVTNCPTCLHFQATLPNNKILSHEIPGRLWELSELTSLPLITSTLFALVDNHSRFPVIK